MNASTRRTRLRLSSQPSKAIGTLQLVHRWKHVCHHLAGPLHHGSSRRQSGPVADLGKTNSSGSSSSISNHRYSFVVVRVSRLSCRGSRLRQGLVQLPRCSQEYQTGHQNFSFAVYSCLSPTTVAPQSGFGRGPAPSEARVARNRQGHQVGHQPLLFQSSSSSSSSGSSSNKNFRHGASGVTLYHQQRPSQPSGLMVRVAT
mmetsp:Transcript_90233/g.173629  ORF Transcript_90233/g.173629 Transcript_90233/m.173629 type:complete len:201 (-) Transcript_90233:477-1079(-)